MAIGVKGKLKDNLNAQKDIGILCGLPIIATVAEGESLKPKAPFTLN